MIQHEEKSGDYGAAIRGDEQTVAWANQTDLGGTDAGHHTAPSMNKVALAFGGVLVIALVFLCFRLAYDGIKTGVERNGLAANAPTVRAAPAYAAPRASVTGRPAPVAAAPVSISAPVSLSAPSMVPPRPIAPRVVFASDADREHITDLLGDCRAAYEASGEASRKWYAANTTRTAARMSHKEAVESDSGVDGPHLLSASEWDSIDTQVEGFSTTVGLATQPARYPVALQGISIGLRREMHTYLQTTRTALAQTDPQRRAAIQARAETHRQKAGQLLATLEAAVKSGTPPPTGTGNDAEQ